MGNIRSKPESIEQWRRARAIFPPKAYDSGPVSGTPRQVEKLEICSDDIEPSPSEYSRTVLMCGGLGLTEPPQVTQWQSFMEIYLMENQLTELAGDPPCPVLLVLFLNRNYKLRTISPSFFDYMPALEILNLSRTRIKSLPESLFRLSRLKRLFLNHCELLTVLPPKIGELQQLEVLDLEGTEIMDLPKEVAKLTKLTCLEVSFCRRTDCGKKSAKANALIPQGTVSALFLLEELIIDVNPEDERWASVVEAIVDDVCGLMNLDTLKLYIPKVDHLRKFKWFGISEVSRSLPHFKFIVGNHDERIISRLPVDLKFELEHWDRSLKYVNGAGVPIDIQKMLQHTIAFFLDRHTDVTKLSDFGLENMEQLKCCIIGECNEIQIIIDETDMFIEADRSEIVLQTSEDDKRFLGSLEYLYVYHMKSLRGIYEGSIHRGCLSHLKCLALVTCPRLTIIFTQELLKNLDSLEELKVEDCPLVKSLVRCEDTCIYDSSYFLPKLKKISLFSLPELISISNGLRIAPKLEQMSISDCPNLKSPYLAGTKGKEDLDKDPKVEGDGPAGSETEKSPAAGGVAAVADDARALVKATLASVKTREVMTPNLKFYMLAELERATGNFKPDTMLGEGRFGKVFKGWVDERSLAPSRVGTGIPVAVKKFNLDSNQGSREWQSEVKFLGKFSHPNLVRLLGYCWEDNQCLLVYEYMQRGSLENHLFRKGTEPLLWDMRLKIAIGAARGFDFLHTLEKNVIYRDFKSSNILLDADYNAKLSDFGLAKLGPASGISHVTTRVMGTYGYAAPEYFATGHLYVKSDVYSFGVVLLEMLTGLQALDLTRPSGRQNLVEWARPSLHNKRKLRMFMDPRLEGQYPLKAATQAAELILKCLEGDPKARPSMDEVLATLERIDTIREKKKKEAKASTSSWPSSHHQHHHNYHRSPIHHKS